MKKIVLCLAACLILSACKKNEIDTTGGIKVTKRTTVRIPELDFGKVVYLDSVFITSPSNINVRSNDAGTQSFWGSLGKFQNEENAYFVTHYRYSSSTRYSYFITNETSTKEVQYDIVGF